MLGCLGGLACSPDRCLSDGFSSSTRTPALLQVQLGTSLPPSVPLWEEEVAAEPVDFTMFDSDLFLLCLLVFSSLAFLASDAETTEEPLLLLTHPPRTSNGAGGGRLSSLSRGVGMACRSL